MQECHYVRRIAHNISPVATWQCVVQFAGPRTAPVTAEAQSAVEVAVSSVPAWNYGQMTQVLVSLASGTYAHTLLSSHQVAHTLS